jgi:DNA-binding NtrC family response regulator
MTRSKPPDTIDLSAHLGAALTHPLSAKLVVVSGPDEGTEVPLTGEVLAGTDADCGLQMHDQAVSRQHAAFSIAEGRIKVRDLGSRNGTFYGGTRVNDAEVPIGAVITLGKSAVAIHYRMYVREVRPSRVPHFGELIGQSLAMREIFAILERIAPTEIPVLVEGESGTGKELVARSIHTASPRFRAPFIALDCSAISPQTAESELFGHVRGAFPGADSDRAGAFSKAEGGTILLDEIGELPLALQPKLLRVLESSEISVIGEDEPRKIDVRIVASSNRDLHAEVYRGTFRKDLLYRLEVVRVRIPPLRQRPEDIAPLAAHLLGGKLDDGQVIEGENLAKLMTYSWPGNVRELRNTLDRAVALAQKPDQPPPGFAQLAINLGPASAAPVSIGMDFPGVSSHVPYKEAKAQLLSSFERSYVDALIKRHKGNIKRAAEAAGLSRKHLYELIRRAEQREDEEGVE